MDPLSAAELETAANLLREHFGHEENLLFETVELHEPPKRVVPGASVDRQARFNVHKHGESGVWRGSLHISGARILSIDFLADARPMISPEEFKMVENAAKADTDFQAALKLRGIENMDLVCVDPWSAGNFGVPVEENRYRCRRSRRLTLPMC